jgi:hypothetical protein
MRAVVAIAATGLNKTYRDRLAVDRPDVAELSACEGLTSYMAFIFL